MDPLTLGLPHRHPFVFVEDVTECRAGEEATGYTTFRNTDPMFAGHFPGDPIVPGVILTEALAQIAGIAGGGEGRTFLLTAIRNMKFSRSVRPGEKIDLAAKKTSRMDRLWMFETRATVSGEIVAEGQIVLNETQP